MDCILDKLRHLEKARDRMTGKNYEDKNDINTSPSNDDDQNSYNNDIEGLLADQSDAESQGAFSAEVDHEG